MTTMLASQNETFEEVAHNASITTRKYKTKWTDFEVDDRIASSATRNI